MGKDFKARGWHPFTQHELGGALVKGDGRAREIYGKNVKKGCHEHLRCNKYDPPYLVLPGGK